jgi:hypothetical protein
LQAQEIAQAAERYAELQAELEVSIFWVLEDQSEEYHNLWQFLLCTVLPQQTEDTVGKLCLSVQAHFVSNTSEHILMEFGTGGFLCSKMSPKFNFDLQWSNVTPILYEAEFKLY